MKKIIALALVSVIAFSGIAFATDLNTKQVACTVSPSVALGIDVIDGTVDFGSVDVNSPSYKWTYDLTGQTQKINNVSSVFGVNVFVKGNNATAGSGSTWTLGEDGTVGVDKYALKSKIQSGGSEIQMTKSYPASPNANIGGGGTNIPFEIGFKPPTQISKLGNATFSVDVLATLE